MPVSTKLASETVPLMGTGGAASSGRIPQSDCPAASASPYSCHQHALQLHQTDSANPRKTSLPGIRGPPAAACLAAPQHQACRRKLEEVSESRQKQNMSHVRCFQR